MHKNLPRYSELGNFWIRACRDSTTVKFYDQSMTIGVLNWHWLFPTEEPLTLIYEFHGDKRNIRSDRIFLDGNWDFWHYSIVGILII